MSAIFGGIGMKDPDRWSGRAGASKRVWKSAARGVETFVHLGDHLSNSAAHLENVHVTIRGYAVSEPQQLDNTHDVAQNILRYYLEHDSIPFVSLDGSFSVLVVDGRSGRTLIYRNLVGTPNVFYRQIGDRYLFATNLRDLLLHADTKPRLNEQLLPVFFLYRMVPGRETLVKNCFRVMPGELVELQPGKITRSRVMTFADLKDDQFEVNSFNQADVLDKLSQTFDDVMQSCAGATNSSAVALSGGVDSTLLQSYWNDLHSQETRQSFCLTIDHSRAAEEFRYAQTAAHALRTSLNRVPIDRPYLEYLTASIDQTGETPDHVQGAFFPELADAMVGAGFNTGITGEAADGVFGVGTSYELHLAQSLLNIVRSPALCRMISKCCPAKPFAKLARLGSLMKTASILHNKDNINHPINRETTFAHLPSVVGCFGESKVREAMRYRRNLVVENRLTGSQVSELQAASMLTCSVNTAAYWNTLFEIRGGQTVNPFLDSRILKLAANLDESIRFDPRAPKHLVKKCLIRRGHKVLATRRKLSFGQPIFEWLSSKGQLRERVEAIKPRSFVDQGVLQKAKEKPNWFLYNLLCLDLLCERFDL
jgi:asparagine synthetase B (glutamine-hydrolysing)